MNKFFHPFAYIRFYFLKAYFKRFGESLDEKALHKSNKDFVFHSRYKFNIRLNMELDVDRYFYLGRFEYETIWFFKKVLKPGMIVFDVGGNIGIFSLIAANKVNNSGSIYAFEPAEKANKIFNENISLNKINNISLFKLGVADKAGTLAFHVCEDDAYNSLGDKPQNDVIYTTEIEVISIDEFCKKNGIEKIDVLKIDTEGAESKIIAGAKRMLEGNKAPIVFCEYNRRVQSKDDLAKLEASFKDYGYKLYYLKYGTLKKFNSNSPSSDIIALKDHHIR